MYWNMLYAGIPDRCPEVFTPLLQITVTTAINATEPYEVLIHCHRAKCFGKEHNAARPSFCFGHLK
jgi:hypothetical protein